MPTKENGAGKQQPYDPTNGKYLGLSNEKGSAAKDYFHWQRKAVNARGEDHEAIARAKDALGRLMEEGWTVDRTEGGDVRLERPIHTKPTDFSPKETEFSPTIREYVERNGDHWFETGIGTGAKKFGTKGEAFEELRAGYGKFATERENEAREKAKEKARLKAYDDLSDESKLKGILSGNIDIDVLSDKNLTEGARVGGYAGHSKSRSAIASEEAGVRPMSQWKKREITDELEKHSQLDPFLKTLSGLPEKKLREIVLTEDGWHHTGKFYKRTDYYAIASPRKIAEGLREYFRERNLKGFGKDNK